MLIEKQKFIDLWTSTLKFYIDDFHGSPMIDIEETWTLAKR